MANRSVKTLGCDIFLTNLLMQGEERGVHRQRELPGDALQDRVSEPGDLRTDREHQGPEGGDGEEAGVVRGVRAGVGDQEQTAGVDQC